MSFQASWFTSATLVTGIKKINKKIKITETEYFFIQMVRRVFRDVRTVVNMFLNDHVGFSKIRFSRKRQYRRNKPEVV